jgi:site-specific DNA-methyltransferase (adenine-specific)
MSGIEINKLYNENCIDTLSRMDDNFIDLVLTSPNYDNARNYHNMTWGEFRNISNLLYEKTSVGGTVVWVVADQTINGCETLSSFKQVLYLSECGFNVLDTMIYEKNGVGSSGSRYCYNQAFEYMFVLTKGKIKTFNPIKDIVPKRANNTYSKGQRLGKSGANNKRIYKKSPTSSKRTNIWKYSVGFINEDDRTVNTAQFPEQLAEDHIISWSNEGDLVYDPFGGGMTTAKMCIKNKRNYICSEIVTAYCEAGQKRIDTL